MTGKLHLFHSTEVSYLQLRIKLMSYPFISVTAYAASQVEILSFDRDEFCMNSLTAGIVE